jgi:glutamate formiminotransferase / formiminotetrahydrofolate cyclodeaminase
MPKIIECIPNFSEGRDLTIIQALIAAVQSVPEVRLLDQTMDRDHHRSVLTFVGPPEPVGEAAYRLITIATRLIDLRKHHGEHPRVGATDVVPFVPIQDADMEDCIQLTRAIGQRVGTDLGIPVFLYEQAATHPDHVRLEKIRQGGLPGLAAKMASNPIWKPDFGPAALHQTAGAIAIGARQPLVAFNVNLNTADLSIARSVAKSIRQSNGGLPCLKAIGIALASRGLVQVAMNLTDYQVTSLQTAFQAVQRESAKQNVSIIGSELIGLVPQAALDQTAAESLHLERFDPAQILETRMAAARPHAPAQDQTVADFLAAVAGTKPTPAGGSVAALVGSLAAALGVMGARLSHQPEVQQQLMQLSHRLLVLVQADCEAYDKVCRAKKHPNGGDEKSIALATAIQKATTVPLEIAELACQAGFLIQSCLNTAKPVIHSDLTVALILTIAASKAGIHTARVNINTQLNHDLTDILRPQIIKVVQSLEELEGLCYTPPPIT